MATIEQIGQHYLGEVQNPSQDSEQWLAYPVWVSFKLNTERVCRE